MRAAYAVLLGTVTVLFPCGAMAVECSPDETPPEFACPEPVVVAAEAGRCYRCYNYATPAATDFCDGPLPVSIVSGLPSGALFPLGTTTNVFRAVDAAGNIATCSLFVTCHRD